eukprot:jgi/Chrzof1/1656/Cz10g16040.t1
MLTALVWVSFLTELFKNLCGRLRPDYLSRCKPNVANFGNVTLQYGQSPVVTCTTDDMVGLHDGQQAFPSGHSSSAYAVGWYASYYMVWCISLRTGRVLDKHLYATAGVVRRIGMELVSLFMLLVLLFQLSWAWGVGVSRFRDNRHAASDIIGGFVLALTFTAAFLVRAVGLHEFWAQYEEDLRSGLPVTDPQISSSTMPGNAAPAVINAVPCE